MAICANMGIFKQNLAYCQLMQKKVGMISSSEFKLLDQVSIITDDKHIVLIIKEMLTLNICM